MRHKIRFRVTEFRNSSGSLSYRVSGYKRTGERVRSNFASHAEAVAEQQRLELGELNESLAVSIRPTRLSREQLVEAEAAFHAIGDRSLTKAVDWFLTTYRDPATSKPLRAAFEEFLAERVAGNLRPHTIRNLRVRVGHLVTRLPDRLVSDVQPHHAADVIDTPGRSPLSSNNERRALHTFFSWCVKKGYCAANPIATVELKKVDREAPIILSLAEVRAMLRAAAAVKDGVLVPYVTLSVFCGLRPAELARLTWAKIDLKRRIIAIDSAVSKVRQRRLVEMPENAVDWLLPFSIAKLPFVPPNFQKIFDAVKEAAGFGATKLEEKPNLKPWVPDALRHTGVSYKLARCRNESETALWAGNSPGVVHLHYKGLVLPGDVELFWAIGPDSPETSTVQLAGAKAA